MRRTDYICVFKQICVRTLDCLIEYYPSRGKCKSHSYRLIGVKPQPMGIFQIGDIVRAFEKPDSLPEGEQHPACLCNHILHLLPCKYWTRHNVLLRHDDMLYCSPWLVISLLNHNVSSQQEGGQIKWLYCTPNSLDFEQEYTQTLQT